MDQQESTAFDLKQFSQRTSVVVVSGLVFPPLGIFLSWRKSGWSPKAKWIATGLMGLLLLWRMGGNEKKDGVSGTTPDARVAAESQSPALSTPDLRAYYERGYQDGKEHGEQMRRNVEEMYAKSNQRALGEQRIRETEKAYKGHVEAGPQYEWSEAEREEVRGRLDGFRAGSRK